MLSLNPDEFSHCQSGVLDVRTSYKKSYYDSMCLYMYSWMVFVYIHIHTHTDHKTSWISKIYGLSNRLAQFSMTEMLLGTKINTLQNNIEVFNIPYL